MLIKISLDSFFFLRGPKKRVSFHVPQKEGCRNRASLFEGTP
jgi:hypothetical protein